MNLVKERALKLYKAYYFPFIVFALLFLIMNVFINIGRADDSWFLNEIKNKNELLFVLNRYKYWKSRILIEYLLVNLVQKALIWKILNTVIVLITIFTISKLFSFHCSKRMSWIIISLSLMIPFQLYWEAGWIATTLNYSWPMGLGLFSMKYIKKAIFKEKIK